MIDKLKPYWEKVKTAFGKISKKIWIAAVVALVAVAAVITFALNNKPYVVLFTNLSSEEAASIMAYLDNQGATDYRLENNDTILVPKDQGDALKARLVTEGYPKSGFAYDMYYANVSSLSTESEREKAYLMTIMESLRGVIRCLDGVKDATVVITPGEDRSYVLDSRNVVNATASVFVEMRDGAALSKKQADGIRNLVAHAAEGLEVGAVSITDNMGNTYNTADDAEAGGEASQLKLRLEEEYNNKIRTSIMQALSPAFGTENVRVAVSCTVDVNRSTENTTNVMLPGWAADGSTNGAGIIGSRIYDYTIMPDQGTAAGGVVGTETNADLPTYVEEEPAVNGTEDKLQGGGQIDYDNPRSETHTERVAGYITDCMVSVTINSTTAGDVNVNSIREHVARAAGITDEMAVNRISILPIPFYEPEAALPIGTGDLIPMWAVYAAGGGLVLFLLILIAVLVLRRRWRKKKAQVAQPDVDALLASVGLAAEPAGADVMTMRSEKSMELRKDIRKFADENPEIAAQMVRSWLRGGEEDG